MDAAGFDGFEAIESGLRVGGGAAPAGKVWIGGSTSFGGTGVEALGVGLPDLDNAIAQWFAGTVEDVTLDDDKLTLCLVVDEVVTEIVGVGTVNADEVGHEPDVDIGAGGLRRRLLEGVEGLRHQLPSRRFSNMVERRPRRTMSNL